MEDKLPLLEKKGSVAKDDERLSSPKSSERQTRAISEATVSMQWRKRRIKIYRTGGARPWGEMTSRRSSLLYKFAEKL